MLAHRTLSALTLALLLFPAAASGQVSDADRASARALAQQGQDALDRKDFAVAADRFGRAGELVRAPTLGLGLARAQVGLGKWIAAQETYNRLLREGVPAGAPAAFAKAIADAKSELDALEPRIPSVVINVKGASNARVTLDGTPVPNAVLGVNRPVDPGKHTVRAEAEGLAPAQVTVTVGERKAETITLSLEPPPAPKPVAQPPPPPPTPAVTPPPPPAATPAKAPPPRAVVPPAAPVRMEASTGSLRKTLGFVGIGVGGAGLAMGLIAGGVALGKHKTLSTLCPGGTCVDMKSAVDSYYLTTNLSTAGVVAGGVLAAAGVVLVVTAPTPKAAKDAWIAPAIGAGYAGAQGGF